LGKNPDDLFFFFLFTFLTFRENFVAIISSKSIKTLKKRSSDFFSFWKRKDE